MARGQIPATVSTRAGVALPAETNGDATNFHYVQNSGKTKILVRNSGVVARTVTVHLARTVDGQQPANRTKAIPAGETHVFGPYPKDDYGTQILIDVDNAELKLRAVE